MDFHKPVDLLLLHGTGSISGSEAWLEATGAMRIMHLRKGSHGDIERLARLAIGTATGLVLSGGGARGYAHVGAIRALREARVPIDFIGGTSMGAVVSAGAAMGWDDREIDERVRQAFVASNPIGDIAFPIIAMTRGAKVKARLREHFGGIAIPDLVLPYFCVSTDLTAGTHRVHSRGSLEFALSASIALPGILPPVVDGDTILVDGGVMRNLPTDIMKSFNPGPLIAVDVCSKLVLKASDVTISSSLLQWIRSGKWRNGFPIASLLLRSATVTMTPVLAAAREAADIFVAPELAGIATRDWKRFNDAVEAGYKATRDALESSTNVLG